jgi:hypothetical protein
MPKLSVTEPEFNAPRAIAGARIYFFESHRTEVTNNSKGRFVRAMRPEEGPIEIQYDTLKPAFDWI